MSFKMPPLPDCIRYCWGRKIPLENGGYQQDAGVPIYDSEAVEAYGRAVLEAVAAWLIDEANEQKAWTLSTVLAAKATELRAAAEGADMSSREKFEAWYEKAIGVTVEDARRRGVYDIRVLEECWQARDAEVQRLVDALLEARDTLETEIVGKYAERLLARIDALLREYDKENKLQTLIDRFDSIDRPKVSGRLKRRDE